MGNHLTAYNVCKKERVEQCVDLFSIYKGGELKPKLTKDEIQLKMMPTVFEFLR